MGVQRGGEARHTKHHDVFRPWPKRAFGELSVAGVHYTVFNFNEESRIGIRIRQISLVNPNAGSTFVHAHLIDVNGKDHIIRPGFMFSGWEITFPASAVSTTAFPRSERIVSPGQEFNFEVTLGNAVPVHYRIDYEEYRV